MYVVFLRFSDNKTAAPQHMDGHNAWIRQGFDDGIFVLTGTIEPKQGGSIIAHNVTREALEARIAIDPFVAQNVVTAEILEISPGKTDPRLDFLAA
ncbi:YciI family protein [Rhizobium sp. L1K21]|uniref:YciI family protein n=1 Tax=Rhizobium sp. L1K21 TaxID=2954933 RepID=UPI0020936844|nr:hypothetical protein [Rhizobium sp. L1K21]MCO6186918.1 hypothetical protein [Rhizobium sp. L1K21]